MKKAVALFLPLVSAAVLPLGAMDALIDVSNIRAEQDMSSRKVTITYDLAETTKDNQPLAGALIRLDVLTNSYTEAGYVSIGNEHIRTVTGDYSQEANSSGAAGIITPGQNKQMVWHARKDFPDMRLEDVKFAVKAYYPGELVFDSWMYLFVWVEGSSYSWRLTDLTPGEKFTGNDEWRNNTTAMWFVLCPAGEFMMGSPNTEHGASYTAVSAQRGRALHKVTLTEPFFMQIAPLTIGTCTHIDSNTQSGDLTIKTNISLDDIMGVNWYSTGSDSAISANSLVGRLRARSGLNLNLPTEAQWEYACRAGSKGTFAGTDEYFTDRASAIAYYQSAFNTEAEVLRKGTCYWNTDTNAWGVAGMHTAIATWCRDGFQTLGTADKVDPCNIEGQDGGVRVVRGSIAWGDYLPTCHYVYYGETGKCKHDYRGSDVGARFVIMP